MCRDAALADPISACHPGGRSLTDAGPAVHGNTSAVALACNDRGDRGDGTVAGRPPF